MSDGRATACDALVVGGGPAGASFAALLAQRGAKIAIVETHQRLERKPGEHLHGSVRGALRALGVPDDCLLHRFSPGILSFWRGSTPDFRSYAASGEPGINVERAAFDKHLLDYAITKGTLLHIGKLQTVRRHEIGWLVSVQTDAGAIELTSPLVVDATGRNASLLRQFDVGLERLGDQYAVCRWLKRKSDDVLAGVPLMIAAGPSGWWSCVEADAHTLSLTFYASQAMMRSKGLRATQWIDAHLAEVPAFTERVRRMGGATLAEAVFPAFPARALTAAGPGFLALGDAAVAYDPVSGLGVAKAMASAFRAAEVALSDPSCSRLAPLFNEAMTERWHEHLTLRDTAHAASGYAYGS